MENIGICVQSITPITFGKPATLKKSLASHAEQHFLQETL
jgi:hypothetical protein